MDVNRMIAKKELEVIGGEPHVYRYWNDIHEKSIDILSCSNRPYSGVASYGTIGLSGCDIGLFVDNKDLRVELLGSCDINQQMFANILASTAFEIMDKGECTYGSVVSNVLSNYIKDSDMQHVYLMNPFLWERFNTMETQKMKIAWLLIVPISEEEKNYLIKNGYTELEKKFEQVDIDIFNLNRKSIL